MSLRPDHLDGPTGESEKEAPWKIPGRLNHDHSPGFCQDSGIPWPAVPPTNNWKKIVSGRRISPGSNISLVFFTQAVSHVLPHSFLDFSLKLEIFSTILPLATEGSRVASSVESK
jgi:hypothetical protein